MTRCGTPIFQPRFLTFALFVLCLLDSGSAAARGAIPGTITFDTDVAGWSFEGFPFTDPVSGSATWIGADGSPDPGALRLQNDGTEPLDRVTARSPCTVISATTPGFSVGIFSATARGRVEGSGGDIGCNVIFAYYGNATCSTPPATSGAAFGTSSTTWSDIASEDLAHPAGLSFEVMLVASQPPMSATPGAACLFDTVTVTGPEPSQIPTASPAALGALGALLAFLGLLVVGRQKRLRST